MYQRILISIALVLLINCFLATAVFAQGSTGTVKGQIVDASGEGVYGITVALSDVSTGLTRSVVTNSSGRFQMQLAPGIYTLKTSG